MIFDPLEEYISKLRALHLEKVNGYFDSLVKRSGVDIEENRKTVKEYTELCKSSAKLKRKLNWLRFLRVVMIITLVLIPLVILKTTPKIKALRNEIENADKRAAELLENANNQMLPLNALFSSGDATALVEETVPEFDFKPVFTASMEEDMRINYDFGAMGGRDHSTLDILAGHYNENPFLFENRLVHTLGTETYHGYKTIHWTETYRDSNGKLRTRSRSQTLHATVTKPKPFYKTQVVLYYCAQAAPELCFSRDASHLETKSERELERHVKRGERKLRKKTDKAISNNQSFMSMSNTEFEVLFDALDRNDEVQFRTLFTPLAQTNMEKLILSKDGYGDDFCFFKKKRTSEIVSNHSQSRGLTVPAKSYISYSFDEIKNNFIAKNTEYFKAIYFDFAPLLAIPAYQDRPVHSLKPIPEGSQLYSLKESEALANLADLSTVAHPSTKTCAILKSEYMGAEKDSDRMEISAYSYDIRERVDVVSMLGGDGRVHNVSVKWDEYIPLEAKNSFLVTSADKANGRSVSAKRNGLCMINY